MGLFGKIANMNVMHGVDNFTILFAVNQYV